MTKRVTGETMTMHVARTLCLVLDQRHKGEISGEELRQAARAVFRAMREPSENQLRMLCRNLSVAEQAHAVMMWQAMIDELLMGDK